MVQWLAWLLHRKKVLRLNPLTVWGIFWMYVLLLSVCFSLIALASFHSLKTCILGYLVAHMNVCLSLCVSPDLVLPYDSWDSLHSDAIHPFASIYRSEWMDATRPFELQIYKVH